MNTRIATILAQEDLGARGTKVIDINIRDIISRVVIMFKAQNAADNISAHPAKNISKIEIVDGSDVLHSLNGYEEQAINFYDRKQKPFTYIDTISGHWNTAFFSIDFGRFLFDPMLAFDPNKFINPQLKITWDEQLCQTGALNSYCEVQAHIFDELVPTPAGFFMTKEVYSYTVAENGYEYIDLPTDFIMQQIFLRCLHGDSALDGCIDEVKISEDNDKRIPFDLTTAQMLRLVVDEYGYHLEHAYLKGSTGVSATYMMPSCLGYGLGHVYGGLEAATLWTTDGGNWHHINTQDTVNMKSLAYGVQPHGVTPLLPKPGNEIADWYDVTKIGSLNLRIKDSAPSAETPSAQIITKQYRTY